MKAMVLCAGYGTRLGELTAQTPKPMLPLTEGPVLAYILGHLRAQGCKQVAINLHFRPEDIQNHFGSGERWEMQITYAHEPRLLGTAGGVKNLEEFFVGQGPFLVHYGDVVTDQDLRSMLAFHRQHEALATLLVHRRQHSNSRVQLDAEGRVVDFRERPTANDGPDHAEGWVNSGVYLLDPALLAQVPSGVPCDWPRDVFSRLVPSGRLFGYALTGYRCAIDSPERLVQAQAAVRAGHCRIVPLR